MAVAADGKTFIQALHDKYTDTEPLSCIIFVSKESGELVLPSHLTLHQCAISQAGNPAEIADLCKDVSELDLADNSIQDWQEVFTILGNMPKVHFLNVSSNPLRDSTVPEAEFSGVTKVVLNSLQLAWPRVWTLMKCVPGCHELHLSLNKYDHFAPCEDGTTHPNITHLLFNGNTISDWAEISKLGRAFPNLEYFVMMQLPISSLPEPGEESVGEDFPKLKAINISKTQIRDWAELEKFKYFPALCEIRLKGIEFLEKYPEKLRRQLVIAYLPDMSRINGSPVGGEEREDAERAFIRHYMDKENKPARYQELEEKHGKLDRLAKLDLAAPSTVSVTIDYNDRKTLHQLQLKWTVLELKKELFKLTKEPPQRLDVFLMYQGQGREDYHPCLLQYPDRTLIGYQVADGDELLILLRDPKPRKKK